MTIIFVYPGYSQCNICLWFPPLSCFHKVKYIFGCRPDTPPVLCTPPPLKMAFPHTWERAKGTVHPLLCPSNFVSLTYFYIFLLVSTKWSKSRHMHEICALRPSPPNLRVHNVMPWYYLNLSFVLILVSVVGGDSTKPIILSRIIQSKLLSPFRLAAHQLSHL